MPKARPELDKIKADLLAKSAPHEHQNIEAVFAVGTELLDSLDRIATALEAKAQA